MHGFVDGCWFLAVEFDPARNMAEKLERWIPRTPHRFHDKFERRYRGMEDLAEGEMRKKRAALKDEIYAYLKEKV